MLEIIERRKTPIIGRLLHESGVWLVAPGRQALRPGHPDPEERAPPTRKAGQVVAVELTEPPSMFSQPVGRVSEVLGEIDDPGMEIEIAVRKYEVPHRVLARSAGAGRGAARPACVPADQQGTAST